MGKRHRYIAAFHAADKDKNGELSREELTEVLIASHIPVEEVNTLMGKFDLNGDGLITLGEYKIALGIATQPVSQWRQLFHKLDRDQSGEIDFGELREFLKNSGMESLISTLQDWMSDFDVNKDGRLNYGEFLGFVASLEA